MTLAFFGEVPGPGCRTLTGALGAALGTVAVHLRLAGGGTFPERGDPRVLWVGVDGDVEDAGRAGRRRRPRPARASRHRRSTAGRTGRI